MKNDKIRLAFYLILSLVAGYISYASFEIFFIDLEITLFEAAILIFAILATWWMLYENLKNAFKLWVKMVKAKRERISYGPSSS